MLVDHGLTYVWTSIYRIVGKFGGEFDESSVICQAKTSTYN